MLSYLGWQRLGWSTAQAVFQALSDEPMHTITSLNTKSSRIYVRF